MYNNSVQIYQEQFHHLVAANFSSEQAEAIMHVIEERQVKALSELATKHDVAEVRTELQAVRTELKHDIAMLDRKFSHRMTLVIIAVFASPYLPDLFRFLTSVIK